MHTVVLGWFGISAAWFVPLFWRLVKAALPGGSGLHGPGTIRLWVGFICVLTASGALEAALPSAMGNALGHAILGVTEHVLGRVGGPIAMLALLSASAPWLLGFRWRDALCAADRALGLGLGLGLPRTRADGSGRAPSSARPPSTPPEDATRGHAQSSSMRVTTVNGMAPKSRGRFARPTVWRPSASPGASATTRRTDPASDGLASAPHAASRAQRVATEPPGSTADSAAGIAGPRRADTLGPARANVPTRTATPATTPVTRRSAPLATQARPLSSGVARSPAGWAPNGISEARRSTPVSSGHRPAAPNPMPSPGVLDTLRSIEENAAQWTTLAGTSLARRGAMTTPNPTTAQGANEEATVPTATSPETPGHEITAHETTASEVSAHDTITQKATAPETRAPQAIAPAALFAPASSDPVASAPDAPAAVASTPDASTPVASTPVASTPVASTPASSTPVASTPASSTPVASTPVASTPASSTPASSTPDASAPVAPATTSVAKPPFAAPAVPSLPGTAEAPTCTADLLETAVPAPIEEAPRVALRGHAATEFAFRAPSAASVELPSLALLELPSADAEPIPAERLAQTSQLIEQRLQEFKVPVTVVGASAGPVITRFEVEPALGVRGSQIVGLMKDLSRGLGLTSIRVVETIPGKTCMGLELPNAKRQMIRLSEILAADAWRNSASKLTIAMGKDITGHPIVTDLAKAPHMLVAGTTGSGKSVAVNAMILSLLYKATPEEVRLIMIDPKMLELSVYEGIPHLLAPVVTDMKLAANALNWCVGEMEKRYRLMSAVGVRNLAGFNQKVRDTEAAGKKMTNPFSLTPDAPEPLCPLPLIVVVIDELADLMMVAGKKIEELIARLAQKARAAGIHLILATQRPSVDVITGLIKANIPTRVAFQVSSKIDSRTILDQMGAESLLGQGDMLFLPPGTGYPQRVHGAFVADEEVHRIVEHLKQFGEPQYEEGILDGPSADGVALDLFGDTPDAEADPLYDEAVAFVVRTRRASISAVQRQLRIGYNRAARLVEQMETAGVVSSMSVNGSREVLAPPGPEQ